MECRHAAVGEVSRTRTTYSHSVKYIPYYLALSLIVRISLWGLNIVHFPRIPWLSCGHIDVLDETSKRKCSFQLNFRSMSWYELSAPSSWLVGCYGGCIIFLLFMGQSAFNKSQNISSRDNCFEAYHCGSTDCRHHCHCVKHNSVKSATLLTRFQKYSPFSRICRLLLTCVCIHTCFVCVCWKLNVGSHGLGKCVSECGKGDCFKLFFYSQQAANSCLLDRARSEFVSVESRAADDFSVHQWPAIIDEFRLYTVC